MKTKTTKKTNRQPDHKFTLPPSYDAGITDAGKSRGFRNKLQDWQVVIAFELHPDVMHLETPPGYFLRGEVYAGLLENCTPPKPDFMLPCRGWESRGYYVADASGRFYLTRSGGWTHGAASPDNWWPTAQDAAAAVVHFRLESAGRVSSAEKSAAPIRARQAKNNHSPDQPAGPVRAFYHLSRAWYGTACLKDRNVTDSVTFGLYHRDGGTTGEMSVEWIPLEAGKPDSPLLNVFSDAWAVLATFQDVIKELGQCNGQAITPEQFCAILIAAGFEDFTETDEPGKAVAAANNSELGTHPSK